MLELMEWTVLVLAALFGGVAMGRHSILVLARLRGRRVTTSFICPKRGCHVECALLVDERSGGCVGVESCSVFGPNAPPRCEQDCAKLLNLGLPLVDGGPEPEEQTVNSPP